MIWRSKGFLGTEQLLNQNWSARIQKMLRLRSKGSLLREWALDVCTTLNTWRRGIRGKGHSQTHAGWTRRIRTTESEGGGRGRLQPYDLDEGKQRRGQENQRRGNRTAEWQYRPTGMEKGGGDCRRREIGRKHGDRHGGQGGIDS